jgi:hypothetical protein
MKDEDIEAMQNAIKRHNMACDIASEIVKAVMPRGTHVSIVCVADDGMPLTLSGTLALTELIAALHRVNPADVDNVTNGLKVS